MKKPTMIVKINRGICNASIDFRNPQKRKEFDHMRLYQQQKELQKMSGYNKSIIIEPPSKFKDLDIQQRNYATVSLFCLTVTNPFRDKIMRIVFNQWFERFILLVILVNCVFLAIDDPNVDEFFYQMVSDYIFLSIFSLEMILKIIAMGFMLKPYSYLRDAWNVLDFIVVIMGWVSKFVTANNVSAIRVIRILRPLRTINSMPGMRRLVQSLLNSLPTLFDIFVLFCFFLVMFGTVATQLFGGMLSRRCFNESGDKLIQDDGYDFFCNDDLAMYCPEDYTCLYYGNPDFDIVSFDNILKSTLNIFIIITLEGWTDIMYYIRHATNTYAYDVFFILIVIIGCFFILNLMVAVQFSYLNMQFQEQKNKEKQLQMLKKKQQGGDHTPKLQIQNEAPTNSKKDNPQQTQENQNASQKFTDNFTHAVSAQSPRNQNQESVLNEQDKKDENKNIDEEKKSQKKKCGCYKIAREKVMFLVESRGFNIFTLLLILLNTTFMAMEHYNMNETFNDIINLGNTILTCFFAAEMLLKLFGLGFKNYVRDGFNDFDAIVVIVGLLEFVNAGSKALTVMRAFRLLRIFKVVKSWTTLKKLLETVLNSFSSIANLGLLMCLLVFIYALIGMQFLSGPIPDNEDMSFRFNFNSFGSSLITIFVLLTAENWNSILSQFIDKDGFTATIYFVTLIIFGNIMLLNLFLAILLSFISENLDQDSSENNQTDEPAPKENEQNGNEVIEEELDYIQERLRIKAGLQQQQINGLVSNTSDLQQNDKSQNNSQNQNNQNNNEEVRIEDISVNLNLSNNNQNEKKISEKSNEESQNDQVIIKDNQKSSKHQSENNASPKILISEANSQNKIEEMSSNQPKSIISDKNMSFAKKTFKTKARVTIFDIKGRSLFIFSPDSKMRLILKAVLQHPYFENFIFHLIALNSLVLALDEPFLADPYQKKTLEIFINTISGIFIVEAILKILVLGFVFGKGTYLRDYWNLLDFTIVTFSVLNWVLDSVSDISVSFLRGFRALRALRPLRMVSKNEGMRVVVNSLLTSIPNLLNVLLISLLFFLVFGILGVQLFKGSLGACNDLTISYKYDCVGQFLDPDSEEMIDRNWHVPFTNFDDIFHSMITFFEISTLENWPEVLFRTIDSVDIDQGPIIDNRTYVALLFVVFIFITTFFVMNLFISVIVDKFNEEIRKKEGSHSFSEEQKEWVKMQRIMVHVNLKILPTMPRNNKFRKFFFLIVTNAKFEFFIIFIIAVNTLFLCMDYYDAPETYDQVMEIGNVTFIAIFTLEAILKIIGHGPKFYFLENWNKFDFFIVILSLISLDDSFSFKVTALRIIRVARLLRMVKASKGLRHLLKTLWLSVGNIANVGMLLCLVFFTFSVAGMDLFGSVQNSDFITNDANFRTFYIAFSTLFRCETGENWNGIMHDTYDQAGLIAIFYWIIFQLITHYILINVFIAVIYDSFNDVKASEDENEVLSLKRKDIKAFVKTWAVFCPNGEHYMKTTQFSAFLMKLPPPLGYEGHKIEQSKLNKIIFCLNIRNHLKDNEGKVYFPEVMWAIFHSIVGNNDEQVHKCEQVVNIMKELKRKYKGLGKNVTPDSLCGNKYYRTEMTVSKYLCARQIYKNWIKYKAQRQKVKEERLLQEQLKIQNQVSSQNNLQEGSDHQSDKSDAALIVQNNLNNNQVPSIQVENNQTVINNDEALNNVNNNQFKFRDLRSTEELKLQQREDSNHMEFEARNQQESDLQLQQQVRESQDQNQHKNQDDSISLTSSFTSEDLSQSQRNQVVTHLEYSATGGTINIDFAAKKGGIRDRAQLQVKESSQQLIQENLNNQGGHIKQD